jgi:hypothetical protein
MWRADALDLGDCASLRPSPETLTSLPRIWSAEVGDEHRAVGDVVADGLEHLLDVLGLELPVLAVRVLVDEHPVDGLDEVLDRLAGDRVAGDLEPVAHIALNAPWSCIAIRSSSVLLIRFCGIGIAG